MFRLILPRPSPRTVITSINCVTRLRHSHPSSLLRSSHLRNQNPGSRLLVVSCTRSPNMPNETPNAGVVEAWRAWERGRVVGQACSSAGKVRTEELGMRQTRFGSGNWFLRQDSETEGRERKAHLTGRIPVPAGLAMAMAMSVEIKDNGMGRRERSLSGVMLVDDEKEGSSRRSSVSEDDRKRDLHCWLPLC